MNKTMAQYMGSCDTHWDPINMPTTCSLVWCDLEPKSCHMDTHTHQSYVLFIPYRAIYDIFTW